MHAHIDNPFIAFVLALLLQISAVVAGDVLRRQAHHFKQGERHDFATAQTATLTLLALITGFSFSMAVTRYDQRKTLEEAEANAIGTEYLRADLLPATEHHAPATCCADMSMSALLSTSHGMNWPPARSASARLPCRQNSGRPWFRPRARQRRLRRSSSPA